MSTTTAKPSKTPPAGMPQPSAEHLATEQVARRLTELVGAGEHERAMTELYDDDARHVEVMEAPWCPRVVQGRAQLIEKGREFKAGTTIHSHSCSAPLVNGDQFVCTMTMDCTANSGPMAGQRMNISETALYTVKNGRISEARFFYGCGA
jgi:hypothetical protein